MSTFTQEMRALATELMAEFGQRVTLDVDGTTSRVMGVVLPTSSEEKDATDAGATVTLYLSGEVRLKPTTGAIVSVGTASYRVVSVSEFSPSGSALFYEVGAV